MKFHFFLLFALCSYICCNGKNTANAYYFDGGISEDVLCNYLSRSVTASELLVADPFLIDGKNPGRADDISYLKKSGVKFIGRAIFRWGREEDLNNVRFWSEAKTIIDDFHMADPDIIFQAAVFEAVYRNGVERIMIPDWVFEAFSLKPESRTFCYDDMMPEKGKEIRSWGQDGAVPDITRTETRMWFYFLMRSYIDIGIEAFHLGQIHLIGRYDKGWAHYSELLGKVRLYAKNHSRRHWVLFDAHTVNGMIRDGHSLIDFNSSPLRLQERKCSPMRIKLLLSDNYIYGKSPACVSPSGWYTDSLPYLVEFDNFGVSSSPGRVSRNSAFVWGYDEITWLFLQTPEYRSHALRYIWRWLEKTDPKGHLQLPFIRVATLEDGKRILVKALAGDSMSPGGIGIESDIKYLWNK